MNNNNYDNEQTQLDPQQPRQPRPQAPVMNRPTAKKVGTQWGRVAGGAAAGILLGSSVVFLSSFVPHGDDADKADTQAPAWSDGNVKVADKVNDDMSFAEAFAAARSEVGAGGAFTWHGNVYGTYYETEWNNMSESERQAYNDHFDWNKRNANTDNATASTAHQNTDKADTDSVEAVASNTSTHHHTTTHTDVHHATYETQHTDTTAQEAQVIGSHPGGSSQDVEILGVTHDDESNMNIVAVRVDNQDALLIDVDNDNEYEVLAHDANHNNQLESNELVDISQEHITSSDLGIDEHPSGGTMMTSDDAGPDYIDTSDPIDV